MKSMTLGGLQRSNPRLLVHLHHSYVRFNHSYGFQTYVGGQNTSFVKTDMYSGPAVGDKTNIVFGLQASGSIAMEEEYRLFYQHDGMHKQGMITRDEYLNLHFYFSKFELGNLDYLTMPANLIRLSFGSAENSLMHARIKSNNTAITARSPYQSMGFKAFRDPMLFPMFASYDWMEPEAKKLIKMTTKWLGLDLNAYDVLENSAIMLPLLAHAAEKCTPKLAKPKNKLVAALQDKNDFMKDHVANYVNALITYFQVARHEVKILAAAEGDIGREFFSNPIFDNKLWHKISVPHELEEVEDETGSDEAFF